MAGVGQLKGGVTRVNRNGYPRKESRRPSAAALAHRLPLQAHQVCGHGLYHIQVALLALADTLSAAYGTSADVSRYAAKLAASCHTLRGHLARELDGEHPLVAAAMRQACYPAPNGQAVEDQGA
jgi:hypothetical protein